MYWLTLFLGGCDWFYGARKQPGASVIAIINTLVVGVSPPFIFITVNWFPNKIGADYPGYGFGITLGFIVSFLLWLIAGLLAKHRYKKVQGWSFLLTNLVIPAALAFKSGFLFIALFELVAFHFLSLGLAIGLFFVLLPFFGVENHEPAHL